MALPLEKEVLIQAKSGLLADWAFDFTTNKNARFCSMERNLPYRGNSVNTQTNPEASPFG